MFYFICWGDGTRQGTQKRRKTLPDNTRSWPNSLKIMTSINHELRNCRVAVSAAGRPPSTWIPLNLLDWSYSPSFSCSCGAQLIKTAQQWQLSFWGTTPSRSSECLVATSERLALRRSRGAPRSACRWNVNKKKRIGNKSSRPTVPSDTCGFPWSCVKWDQSDASCSGNEHLALLRCLPVWSPALERFPSMCAISRYSHDDRKTVSKYVSL